MAKLNFTIEQTFENARAGNIHFASGLEVLTPVFMPVGTVGSVKGISQQELQNIGYKLILGNTYHLYLRPGMDVISHFGSLHKFISWQNAILTDSGGFQAFSLSDLSRYREDGVEFRSHLDGSTHLFTPEKVLQIQNILHSDIVMPIDDCAPYPADEKRLQESLTRTHRWLQESVNIFREKNYTQDQNLFSIAQGGTNLSLRKESAQFCASQPMDGFAIGGLSVGEKNEEFLRALEVSCEHLPKEKPRYLMGVGSLPEIIHAVALGVDMMDCVLPTRNARNGQVFTSQGKVNLRASYNRLENRPIDEQCNCYVCQNYSLGYIRHLHKSKEILALTLSTYHNLHFMHRFMQQLRESIVQKNFHNWAKHWLELYSA